MRYLSLLDHLTGNERWRPSLLCLYSFDNLISLLYTLQVHRALKI
jgi:hypothetical protein